MVPKPAQYLLRFDDLCPTLSPHRWQRFLPLIEKFKLRPILAVVPDNQDHDLRHAESDPGFWVRMRAMEAAGATIALHGYRHLCLSPGKSMLPLHTHSEFAGVAVEVQRKWIEAGLQILRNHALNPRVWVAPRHGFDRNTLWALRHGGIKMLSDGFARVPFVRGGIIWIPQQLWSPVEKSSGLWTICIHANTALDSQVEQLRIFLTRHAAQFTSVDRVVAELKPARLGVVERYYERFALLRIQVSRAGKRRRR